MNKILINKKPVRVKINGILCNVSSIKGGAVIEPPEPIIPPEPSSEWIGIELPFSSEFSKICYGNGKFVGMDNISRRSIYSIDGFNWEIGGEFLVDCKDIAYGSGTFACISSSYKSSYSYDGINWEGTKSITLQNPVITYGNDKFVVLSSINGHGCYSHDAISWDELSYPYSTIPSELKANIMDIAFGGGTFVTATFYGKIIYYSKDGVNWEYSQIDDSAFYNGRLNLNSITYGNGMFVAVPRGGKKAVYSKDGINWDVYTFPDFDVIKSVVYGDGKFVAIKEDMSFISEDGINWWELALPNISSKWDCITYGDKKFVALSTDGKAAVLYSSEIVNPNNQVAKIGTAKIGTARIAKG